MPKSLYDSLHPEEVDAERARQCGYTSKGGWQCPRRAADGESMCVLHGASVVRAQDVVQRKLVALQEKAIASLEEILDTTDDKTRLTAVTVVLDRTGLGPKSTIAVDATTDLSQLSPEDLLSKLEDLREQTRAEMQRQRMYEALMKQSSASGNTH